jgi:hypothetical protein
MIDSILKNIERISDNRDFFEVYYKNIASSIGLKESLALANNIKSNKPYYPLPNSKIQNTSTKIATKIINKDDFVLPSQTERVEPKEELIQTKTIFKIQEDDQFEHDDI